MALINEKVIGEKQSLTIFWVRKKGIGHFVDRQQQQLASQCDQIGDLLDFGQLFKAFGNN